jgi:TRAP-type mannitol/chloroaromatic compound transport system permease small subunit
VVLRALEILVGVIDSMNEWIGRIVAWLTLGTVLVCFTVVVLRYAFSTGYIWMQEMYVWQHAIVFMVGAGYTFLHGGHVRVDIFYAKSSERTRAWVDIFGTLVFLFPWLVVLVITSVPYIGSAWAIREASREAGGLPGFFLLKSMIWVFAVVVGLQGLSLIARRILFLSGRQEYAPEPTSH